MALRIEGTEKDIEDVLCENMKEFLGLRFVARQAQTPAGVIDIIAAAKDVFYVIELKRDTIDTHAYAQVMRYCNYLNFNKSKNGKRVFAPLLIGEHLSGELYRNVKQFEESGENFKAYHLHIPEYALFQFNPLSGISFSYYSPAQQEYADEHFFNQSTYAERENEDLLYKNYKQFLEIAELKRKIPEGAV